MDRVKLLKALSQIEDDIAYHKRKLEQLEIQKYSLTKTLNDMEVI